MRDATTDELIENARTISESYQRIAAKMFALDSHGGREFLRSATLDGATALAATRVNKSGPVVWTQFDELRRLVERIPAPSDIADSKEKHQADLETILTGECVTLDVNLMPTNTSQEPVHSTVTLASFATDIESSCTALLEVCTDVDTACGAVADQISDINAKLTAAAEDAASQNDRDSRNTVDTLRQQRDDAADAALADPLTAARESTLSALEKAVVEFGVNLRKLQELQTDYPQRILSLRNGIVELAAAEDLAVETCTAAATKIALPVVPQVIRKAKTLFEAAAEAENLAAKGHWHRLNDRLTQLDAQVRHSLADCRSRSESASSLIDRRAELRGRFFAYSKKAARIGVIEEPHVCEIMQQTQELLRTVPCDLKAATSALYQFQQAISG